uniref:Small ribosomal subunit protein uS3m n=1 Tax=Pyramimonas parkeae TaxID=36894 RepID=A0A1S5R1T4_9CHLO|nr:ribosomal protein S3 [Pyramimonas parkeae]
MGQKVNPISLRLGINRQHDSIWFGDFHYPQLLGKELIIRDSISKISENANLPTARMVTKIFPQKMKMFPFLGIRKSQPSRENESVIRNNKIFLSNLIGLTTISPKNSVLKDLYKESKISEFRISIKSFSNSKILKGKKVKLKKTGLAEIKENLQKKLKIETNKQENLFESTKKSILVSSFENFFTFYNKCQFGESFRLLTKYKMLRISHNLNWSKKRKTFLVQGSLEHIESSFSKSFKNPVQILPLIIKNPYKSANLLAKKIAVELEKTRVYRKVLKVICNETENERLIKGIRISCSGRLGGVELAETAFKKMGPTSLQEFSQEIDYAYSESITKFGLIGVKVWLCFLK